MSDAQPKTVTIGLVQETWHRDPAAHAEALRQGVLCAAEQGAQLVCLQELTLHRYFGDVKDKALFKLAEPLEKGPTAKLCKLLAKEAGVFVVGSLYERAATQPRNQSTNQLFFNTAILTSPQGKFFGFTRKQHIPRGTGYNEDFYFQPGDSDYPVHDLGFIKLAIPTCYDQWFPELARIYALKGAELIVYPTAIGSEPDHPEFDSQPLWQHTMTAHAIANGVFIAAVNRTGDDEDAAADKRQKVTFYGSSFVCEPTGKIIAQAPRNKPAVVVAKLDFGVFEFWRRLFPLLTQRQPNTYKRLLKK
jgi:N-carbamoylputrescine amidase